MTRWGKFAAIVFMATLAAVAGAVVFAYSLEGKSTHRFAPKTRSSLAGHWESNLGGSLQFKENGEFSATNINLEPTCSTTTKDQQPNPRMSGSGEWNFGSPSDDDGPAVVITFKPDGLGVADCTVWGRLGGDDANPEIYLRQDDRTREYYQRPVSK
ncbi:hypothetical protein ABZ891_08440 [Streptomyces sp. NPDC047023]|uniref:hypothetical protein n=1 Tax=Streptomyces sp. NPDC047023 TaxID=3155139 RepID=UPI0033FB7EEC